MLLLSWTTCKSLYFFATIFNELMMRSALYYTNTLSWISILLAHWNNCPAIDMLLQLFAFSP
jgi:hypothetical protein